MLDRLKRLFSRSKAPGHDLEELAEWAGARRYSFRPVRGDEGGFVIEDKAGALPWRMEWGPSQRPYFSGFELRLRAELSLPGDVQVLVLDCQLLAALEKTMFDQYVESTQTRIDDQTPPEMRWLVMYPKLSGSELGGLRDRFGAVAPGKAWVTGWLDGPLTPSLLAAPLTSGQPIVLMISRGRLTLRTALGSPDPRDLDRWLRVFHTAVREARRMAEQGIDPDGAETPSSLFSVTRGPDETA